MTVWVLTKVDRVINVEVDVFANKVAAEQAAAKYIRQEAGVPSDWREDEWPQMRQAMKEGDVPAQIEHFNAQFSDWKDGFVSIEKQSVKGVAR